MGISDIIKYLIEIRENNGNDIKISVLTCSDFLEMKQEKYNIETMYFSKEKKELVIVQGREKRK